MKKASEGEMKGILGWVDIVGVKLHV
jgi:hypothetical protein